MPPHRNQKDFCIYKYMDVNKLKKFLETFSLITVAENKVPNFQWKSQQSQRLDWTSFYKNYNYDGSIIKKDGTAIPKTTNFGIVTGFEHLECIDVDLKVFSTAKEQIAFWSEYLAYLKDNILDFDDKIVIYKTRNAGYHLLYKSKRVGGNVKLAKLKGHQEAVIETRGVGGYIFAYPDNKTSKKSYHEIDYISDQDRDVIMSFSKMYNYQEPIVEKVKIKHEFVEGDILPWHDYNNKNNIWDIVSSEFTIVGNHNDKIIIKRHNSTSPHSGYIYKNDNIMFLFSTGTCYPNQKPINPFTAYTYQNFNGDFSTASKQIYNDGYGSRKVKKEQEPKEKIVINTTDLQFPLDIFPKSIQSYVLECNETLDSSIDYMGCALLWLISISIGNSMQIEVKRGWTETATLWLAIVGKAGIGKTPSISNIIFPLEKINNREISNYIKEYEKYEYFKNLSKKDQDESIEVQKPNKKQFIANDITIEALVDLHQQNDNAVGVFKDELAGWFKDMNKYKAGADLETWLSSWSGKSINLNRLTRAGSFVARPMMPVLGGIQPSIFNSFYTEDNKDNGFMDRMLLSFPELSIEKYNDKEMDYNTIEWYSDTIVSFYDTIKNKLIKRDQEGNIEPVLIKFNQEAKVEWMRIFNEITDIQNSESENEYMKSMLPKLKSYIPRFSLLINTFNGIGETNYNINEISKDSILKAEKLSKYFIAMAKKVKIDSIEVADIRKSLKANDNKTNKEKFKMLYDANKNLNKKEVSEQLGVSLQMVYKYLKEIENEPVKV
jgi:hypothetical protein